MCRLSLFVGNCSGRWWLFWCEPFSPQSSPSTQRKMKVLKDRFRARHLFRAYPEDNIFTFVFLFVTIQPSRRWNADNARFIFRHSEPGRAKRATVRNLAPSFGKTTAGPTTIAQDPSSLTLLRVTEGRGAGVSNIARRLITTLPKIGTICVDLRHLRSICSSLNSYFCFTSALSASSAVNTFR